MKTVYKENGVLKEIEFSIEWLQFFGIELLSKKYIPQDIPFWFVTDDELLTLEGIPLEAWEVEGEPDGIGGLSKENNELFSQKLKEFQNGSGYQQYEITTN